MCIAMFLAFAFSISFASAAASFQVTSFACSPSEVVINSIFSCTATVQNTGDAAGTLSTATLYPSSNWLEDSNYPQSYGQSVDPSNSVTVTFSNLRATKSGDNGFTKIMLDSATDTYVADNNKKVNVINVAVTLDNSASSAIPSATWTTTAEVTAGGNIDVSLEFTSNSGGCTIGSQTNPRTITGMSDGGKQSRTWTITQGSSGDCSYTVSATGTGTGGVASKTDSTSNTVTCTNCSSGGGSGSGGAGSSSSSSSSNTGAGTKTYLIGELKGSNLVELVSGQKASFLIASNEHIVTLQSLTNTSAVIEVRSTPQTFTLNIGNEINVDLNEDKENDIVIKLLGISINSTSKTANIIITRLAGADKYAEETKKKEEATGKNGNEEGKGPGISLLPESKSGKIIIWVLIAIAAIAIIIFIIERYKRMKRMGLR